MPERIYLDSNVLISFIREEIDYSFNTRYLDSETFFDFCRKKEFVLLLSAWFFKEVQKIIFLDKKEILEVFNKINVKVIVVSEKPKKELVNKINKDCNLHYAAAVHVAVAYENKTDFIVTWNKKDFEKANKFVKCFSPKEILYTL